MQLLPARSSKTGGAVLQSSLNTPQERCKTYLKGKVVGVAVVNGVINVLDPDDRNDRAKGLLPCNAHVLQRTQQAFWVTHLMQCR